MIPAPPTAGQPLSMSRPGVRSRPQPRRPAFLSQNPLAGSSVPSIPTTGLWLSIYTNHISMHFLIVWWNSWQNTPYTLKEELCHHKHNKRQICSILLENLIKTCCCNFLGSRQLPNLISRVMQVLLEVAYDIFLAFVLFSLLLRGYQMPWSISHHFQMKASGSQAMKKKLNHSYNLITGILDFVLLVQVKLLKILPPSTKQNKNKPITHSLNPKIIRVLLQLDPAPHKFVKKPPLVNISEKGVQIQSALKLCQNSIFIAGLLGWKVSTQSKS